VLWNSECDAAYKLAAALSNYDKDDYRILKFLDIKVKEDSNTTKQEERKNYIEMNKQKISDMMVEIKKMKTQKKEKPAETLINKT
jgi:hypothetical protein